MSILSEKLNQLGQKEYPWIIFADAFFQESFAPNLLENLKHQGFNVQALYIPSGEESKSFHKIEWIYEKLLQLGANRKSQFIGLGGGVITDITGFIAGTYMRGVDYYSIPTSLLGMVDASVGGKTGVNISSAKNLVGLFYQPKGVFIDPIFLKTLPKEEFISGLAEVVKYGIIWDKSLFETFESNLTKLIDTYQTTTFPIELIHRCCQIKAEIVQKDEKEKHQLRSLLNFGHTVGHAIEATLGYGSIRHGEAIIYGMQAAANLSVALGSFSHSENEHLQKLLAKFPLPNIQNINQTELKANIQNDKKKDSNSIRFILLKQIGEAFENKDLPEGLLEEVLSQLFS